MTEPKQNFRVDFFGIGAARSGTTWLADNLGEHPDVFLPEAKEIGYFNRYMQEDDSIESYYHSLPLSWYHNFFKPARPGQLTGEVNPAYLPNENCAQDIHAYNPNARLIAILREPVTRAFSNYLLYLQRGVVPYRSFEEALEKRPQFLRESCYGRMLQRYLDVFPREQILVLFHDDLVAEPAATLHGVQSFLGLSRHTPEAVGCRRNESLEPRWPGLNRAVNRIRFRLNRGPVLRKLLLPLKVCGITPLAEYILSRNARRSGGERPALDGQLARSLRADYFREDVKLLESLTGRDLSAWRE